MSKDDYDGLSAEITSVQQKYIVALLEDILDELAKLNSYMSSL